MSEDEGESFKISCPHCGQHIEFPAHGIGQVIDCPTCIKPLLLAAAQAPPVIAPPQPRTRTTHRNWEDDCATEKQLSYLSQFGYVPDRPITKGEASKLIDKFQDDPERLRILNQKHAQAAEMARQFELENTAWCLHEELEGARRDLESAEKEDRAGAKADYNDCLRNRVAFWADTFSDTPKDYDTVQWAELFEKFGKHCKKPTVKQIKDILTALDSHTPDWDKDKPQSFFHTLKDNFPELLR